MGDQIIQVGNVCPTKTRSNPNQGRVYDPAGVCPTLSCMGGGNLEPHVIIYNDCDRRIKSEMSDTATSPGFRVRKLTPKECWRLMGFEDDDFEKAKERMNENLYNGKDRSSSQLYKQAGNSIVVDVLIHIMESLHDAMPYLFENIVVGSFFSGIGAFEKALTKFIPGCHSATQETICIEPNNKTLCINSKVNGKQPSLSKRIYDTNGVATAVTTGDFFMPTYLVPDNDVLGIVDPQGRANKVCAIKPECPTLRAQTHGNPPGVVYGHCQD